MKTATVMRAFWRNLPAAPDFDATFARQLAAGTDSEEKAAALEAEAKEIRKAGRAAVANLRRAVVTLASGWTEDEQRRAAAGENLNATPAGGELALDGDPVESSEAERAGEIVADPETDNVAAAPARGSRRR